MSDKKPFSCFVIEPHFYDDLNWDMDKIVKYLEFIRLNINDLFKHKHSKYYIIAYRDFLGNSAPAIGVINNNAIESKDFDDFDDLFNTVEKWVNSIGLDTIENKSNELNVPKWKKILELKYYPKE
ncbi:hypothetical protein [Flavobacterium sp.]|uniref:hypothetical protein n=1 Tax=Flavobacterium sp. TaxID=239 RepID=UPI0028BF1D50|nr:hypothetical protein [Flavobacterium sp.]